MVTKNNRPTVADIRAMKGRGQKISMLYVTTLEEAAAADAAGVDMLSIEGRFFSSEVRDAAGRCFVQVGLPYGPFGNLVTAKDYLEAAYHFMGLGGDCFYCAASLDIQKTLCDNAVPIVAHVGLIPSQCTWTGGFKAVGKDGRECTCSLGTCEAVGGNWLLWRRIGGGARSCCRTDLQEHPHDHAGNGRGTTRRRAVSLSEDVLGHTSGHKPRHAKTYRNFASEYERLQRERIAAYREFISDVRSGVYPEPQHSVPVADEELASFKSSLGL